MPINYSKWDAIGSSDDEANDAADRREVEAMLRGAVDMDPIGQCDNFEAPAVVVFVF